MVFEHLLNENKKYGSNSSDIVKMHFHCEPDEINENVIIAPSWYPQIFQNFIENIIQVLDNQHLKIWNISVNNKKFTYIVTGIGAPKVIETVLALGCTPCRKIIFIGSVGGLVVNFNIGDIIIPEY